MQGVQLQKGVGTKLGKFSEENYKEILYGYITQSRKLTRRNTKLKTRIKAGQQT